MSVEESKTLVKGFIDEVLSAGMTAKIADYCVEGSMFAGGVAGQIEAMRIMFPDLTFTLDDMVAEGDKVVAKVTANGTHTGPIVGLPAFGRLEKPVPPTGLPAAVSNIYIFTVTEGKIISYIVEIDQIGLLSQLGWTFTPPS